jgi:chromosomal replication initiator protein
MWFEGLSCATEEEGGLVLEAPSEFNAIWVQSNYLDIISRQAESFAGTKVEVSIRSRAGARPASRSAGESAADRTGRPRDAGRGEVRPPPSTLSGQGRRTLLNPRNTFDNFVVGSSSQLAHAASMAVASAPGRAYNPLFLFGDTGLGKTHLMHAVAHHMIATNPEARVAYVSTEKFTNEFIHSIRENRLAQFRKFYRNVDALLVDDIHFLSGKESTQEEFFHTFNELFESGRQIFLASDRPANEIDRLENRLISRFQWGLVTDVQAPDFETRVAILRKKAAGLGISLPEEIIDFLAERVSRNVRVLEGALTRIGSYGSLINRRVDLDSVQRLLGDLLQEEAASRISVEEIQKRVSEHHRVPLTDMLGRRRTSNLVLPRQIAMYISRTLTPDPLKAIGDAFGGRDHGTVIHACRQVENLMEQDATVKRAVDYLVSQLSRNRRA